MSVHYKNLLRALSLVSMTSDESGLLINIVQANPIARDVELDFGESFEYVEIPADRTAEERVWFSVLARILQKLFKLDL